MSAAAHGRSFDAYETKFELRIIMLCSMAGTLMQALDSTIANVALPYMQGSLAASRDQITWVLTSYIVSRRDHDGAGRLDRVAVRPEELRHRQPHGLHRDVDDVRLCADAGSDGDVPPFAGRVRRSAFAALAVDHARSLSAGETRLGDGDLGHGRDGGTDPGSHARRLSHRCLRLALGVLCEPAVRYRRRDGHRAVLPRHPSRHHAQIRLERFRACWASASAHCS